MKLLLLLPFLLLTACNQCSVITPPAVTTTIAPATTLPPTTVAPTPTPRPTTTVPAPTTPQMPSGPVTCQVDFNTGSVNFVNFNAVMAAAKVSASDGAYCVLFAGVNYCAQEGGCFGPCSRCWPQGSMAVQSKPDRSKPFKVNYPTLK